MYSLASGFFIIVIFIIFTSFTRRATKLLSERDVAAITEKVGAFNGIT